MYLYGTKRFELRLTAGINNKGYSVNNVPEEAVCIWVINKYLVVVRL